MRFAFRPRTPVRITGLVLVMLLTACDTETPVQQPDGPVVDKADILPADIEAALDSRLRAYWEGTGNAVVVASIKSLEGKTIEQTAFDSFNEWGIGDAATNRGLLLLVAPNDRMVRIEVGCGLESVITNDVAAQVIKQDILPEYQEGAITQGTLAGVDALIKRLDADQNPGPVSTYCSELMKKAA